MGLKDELPLHRDVSLMRIIAQGLVPATQAQSVGEVVRRNLALQGQQADALPHALSLRVDGGSFSAVAAAFNTGEVVRCRPMRGTVHAVPAESYHWLRQALRSPWKPNANDVRFNITAELLRDAVTIARDEMRVPVASAAMQAGSGASSPVASGSGATASAATPSAGTPSAPLLPRVTRNNMFAAWQREGLAAHLPQQQHREFCTRIMYRLDQVGAVLEGPLSGERFTAGHDFISGAALPQVDDAGSYVRMQRLEWESFAAECVDEHREWQAGAEFRGAIAVLAYHYAVSHGPVTAADLARWASIPVSVARRGLADAAAGTLPIAVAGPGVVVFVLREDGMLAVATGGADVPAGAAASAQVFYLRDDLPDLLVSQRQDAERLLHLPAFDELHVGYKNRTCLTDYAGELVVCPTQNGLNRQIAVEKGRLVAAFVGSAREPVLAPGVRESKRLAAALARALRRTDALRGL